MPLNERYLSSKFHGYHVKRASACVKSLLLVEAATAWRLLALLSVVCRLFACALTIFDACVLTIFDVLGLSLL